MRSLSSVEIIGTVMAHYVLFRLSTARVEQRTRSPWFVLLTDWTPTIKSVGVLYESGNCTPLRLECKMSTNVARNVVVYALPACHIRSKSHSDKNLSGINVTVFQICNETGLLSIFFDFRRQQCTCSR